MKVNKFVALALIAFLAIGAMGLISTRSLAKTAPTNSQQVQVTAAPGNPAAEAPVVEEASAGLDTDNIQDQSGNQVEDGQPDGAQAPAGHSDSSINQLAPQALSPAIAVSASSPQTKISVVNSQAVPQAQVGQPAATEALGTDTGPDQQSPAYTSSTAVNQASNDGKSDEASEAAALASQAKISLEQAKAAALAANPGTSVVKAELDNENGALVYSVELSNGSDVKVDAGNAAILHTETGGDTQD
jgi:uncharacterized membrane protein YkoI